MLFLLIPKVLKIAISLVFLVAICITEEDRLNEATTIIRNNVKKVIFFSTSVASNNCLFLCFHETIFSLGIGMILSILPMISISVNSLSGKL